MARKGKRGEKECGVHLSRMIHLWLRGHGPGGPRTSFPSATARLASGQTLREAAEGGCVDADLVALFDRTLKDELRKDRRRS